MDDTSLKLRAHFYSQFDADYTRDVPAEGYGGWHADEIELESHRVAIVLMHAWDSGTLEENPGAWKCCDEVPRTYRVCRDVLPPLLSAIRATPVPIFHVVGGAGYFEQYAGYQKAVALAGPDDPAIEQVSKDGKYWPTKNFITDRTFPGKQNKIELAKAPPTKFPKEAVPMGNEGIAKNAAQLFALCKEAGVNHLIYMGFNIDWCLLMSPAGMNDMWRHGLICSAVRQAVTAVENKETARGELCKEIGLWRVSVQGGLVIDDHELIRAVGPLKKKAPPAGVPVVNQTWVEAGGEVYGAKPDARGPIGGGAGYTGVVTTGDFIVRDLLSLLSAASRAQPGQTIFVESDAVIDFTEEAFLAGGSCVKIPAGVTLASGRGHHGAKGALLHSDAHLTTLLRAAGPGVRISGLRLRGPDPSRRLAFHHRVFTAGSAPAKERDEAYYKLPNSDCIISEHADLTVDNCEISGWSHAGVYLVRGAGHHVHHCFIHHTQRMGLGYGVCHNHDSQSRIEHCLFQDNKHHIAGTGSPGQCYEAAHNVVLPYTETHVFNGKIYGQDHLFDMHGGEDRRDGTDIAGRSVHIHHNTFMSKYVVFALRGEPQNEARLNHNWFYTTGPGVTPTQEPIHPIVDTQAKDKAIVHDNAYGEPSDVRVGLD